MPRRSWNPFRARPDRDFADEIRAHLELEADQLVADGVPRAEAEARARRTFGNVTRAQERYHDTHRIARVEQIAQDVRFALRQLRRSPALATVIVLTLALGVGANTAIFAIVDRLLLRAPAGISAPNRVRRVYIRQPQVLVPGEAGLTTTVTSYPMLTAMREVKSFSQVAGVYHGTFTLGRGAEAQQVDGEEVTGNYFQLLGAHMSLGRALTADDDRLTASASVVVLSYGFWQRQFGGARDVLGKTLRVDDALLAVIGVAAEHFNGVDLENVDLWMPVSTQGLPSQIRQLLHEDWMATGSIWINGIARLAPGATDAGASAEATEVYRRTAREWSARRMNNAPDTLGSVLPGSIIAARGPGAPPQDARVSLWLAGVAGIVLIIACANVANLLLARGVRRRREIAMRLALGVGRRRLVQQFLTETCVLALLAALVGLFVAVVGGHVISALLLPVSSNGTPAVNGRMLLVTMLAAFVAAFVAGAAPAIQATRLDIAARLAAGARDSGRRSRLHIALLVTQAALSVVLLVGAGLFVRSLHRVRALDVGIDLSHVLLVSMDLSGAGYDTARARLAFEEARERVQRLPGVLRVSIPHAGVPKMLALGVNMSVAGRDTLPALPNGGPYFNVVDDDYFETLGARIIRGRGILPQDMRGTARVAVVNETIARHYWPNVSPIGRCISISDDHGCTEIVGVVQDVLMFALLNDERSQVYVPPTHAAFPGTVPHALLVRTTGDSRIVANAAHRALQSMASDMPFVSVRSYEDMVAPEMRAWRLGASMFSIFGALALVIAAVGLYGALAYAVSQRGREISVRMALGARGYDVIRLVTVTGMRIMIAGIVIGSLVSLALGRLVAPVLYATSPRDPSVFALVILALLLVSLAAMLIPAWRATRVDAATALRAE